MLLQASGFLDFTFKAVTIDLKDILFSRHTVIETLYLETEFLVKNNLQKCSSCFLLFFSMG